MKSYRTLYYRTTNEVQNKFERNSETIKMRNSVKKLAYDEKK